MALQNNVILIRIVLIIGYLLHGYQCVVLPSPKVDSDVLEHVIETSNNFSILCEGNAPLKWVSPTTENKMYRGWTNISYHDVVPKHNHYKYASQLYIENATFPFTGYYQCFEQGNSNSSNIYLYVSDDEHLSVLDQSLETITVTQYSEVTIPCRPTSPEVTVTLQHMAGEEIEIKTFNPKTGFSLNVSNLTLGSVYLCIFNKSEIQIDRYHSFERIDPVTDSLALPYILEDGDRLHHVVGDTIILKCTVKTQVSIDITWDTPTGNIEGNPRMNVSELTINAADDFQYQRLTVGNVTLADRGTYSCNVKDHQGHFNDNTYNVTIYDLNESFINLTKEKGIYEISTEAGVDSVRWAITINAHPQPKVTWLNNQNIKIPSGRTIKYEIDQTEKITVLKINNISITDFGNYTVVAENKFEKKFLSLFLNVTAKPSVQLRSGNDYHVINEPDVITCTVAAYPEPNIAWESKPCLDDSCQYQPIPEESSHRNGFEFISNVTLKFPTSGFVRCSAVNNMGNDSAVLGFYVTDIKNGLNIFGLRDDIIFDSMQNYAIVATGEEVELICGASVHNYTGVKWFHNSILISSDDTYSLQSSQTLYSNRLMLTISNISIQEQGLYTCRAESVDDHHVLKNITLSVENPIAPEISDSNMPISNNIEMDLPERLELHCIFKGLPKPTITWFKDNEVFSPTDDRIIIEENNEKIIFSRTETKDEATYSCEGSNKVGKMSRQASVVFKNKPTTAKYISIIVVLIFLLVVGLAILLYKIRKQKELVKALAESGLANFEKGALENLNPELGIDDQAELLPYDKKWEFPISNLKLGKQLGSGAFGVVMRGEAKGILEDEKTTTVAVKMVKRDAGHTFVKALASELKIMVHLGKHLNVVNLLGACTKNVAKRELLVIVEFCRFGNLHNYLYRHRENYIDQIDPRTEQIDFNIGQEILERAYSIASNRSNSTAVPNNMGDYRGPGNYSGVTMKTDTTTVSMSPNTGTGEDSMGMSNSNCQPEWCTNYKGDYKGNVKPISTKDLLAWAFQVARGMEYLASRKILHGDLAARNILLADENIVKICDFGLAKSMYKNDNYKKNSDGPLPVKWMAIESIRDRVFSTQSDVWSFGILLWEFFSLARTPYPGMDANEDLYKKIVEGYRMECPEYATKNIYRMMLDCWQAKPLNRPSFIRLTERLGAMLEDSVRQHYIDLNDPYLMMNTQRLVDGHSDYLAMLTSPNFENLSSPQPYMNVMPASPSENVSGYMSMKSPNIFSPRMGDENVFDFDLPQNSPTSKVKSAEGTGNEMMPMLQTRESESDTPCSKPTTPFSFANPSYQLPPVISDTVFDKTERDIVKSVDNYVNMPQNKILVKEKNNNPLIKVDEDTKDVHYVNSNSRDWNSINV